MMKKTLLMAIAIGLCSLAQAADSWQITLTTNNAVIAPALKGYTAIPATNSTAYSAGAYVTMPNGRDYWTPDGGTYTTANAPTHRIGIETSDDSIKWLALKSSRTDITVQLTQSGVDVWFIEDGDSAVNGESRLLTGKGMAFIFDDYAGEINGLAGSGTATITVTEK